MASYPPYEMPGYSAAGPHQPAAPADPYAAYAQPMPGAFAAAPVAVPGASPYGYPPGGTHHPDEVRTVFVTGFPDDVKERELNNMLRFLPGYEVGCACWAWQPSGPPCSVASRDKAVQEGMPTAVSPPGTSAEPFIRRKGGERGVLLPSLQPQY